jgi:hypothetical protein
MSAAADAASAAPNSTTSAAAVGSDSSGVVIFDREALRRPIRGVVFDMDGTLTVPVIDFQYMRQVGGKTRLVWTLTDLTESC